MHHIIAIHLELKMCFAEQEDFDTVIIIITIYLTHN